MSFTFDMRVQPGLEWSARTRAGCKLHSFRPSGFACHSQYNTRVRGGAHVLSVESKFYETQSYI
jgi:hypothetical protein